MGLLRRITQGFTGRADEQTQAAPVQQREPVMTRQSEQRRPLSQDAAAFAPRNAHIDDTGRVAPQARQVMEEDPLEIPAFLRRQG